MQLVLADFAIDPPQWNAKVQGIACDIVQGECTGATDPRANGAAVSYPH
ncbi:MAG: hypothetical protein HYV02_03630 [Deltaproteobacteria bacterium]|nr:hypothetical protein [Deltaproteobacteria bacterium]